MTVRHAPDVADKFTTQLIRRTAKMLVSDGAFPASDLDDVVQELRLALIEQAENFDPDRARWSTFVKTVVRLTASTLRRKQRAEFRQAEQGFASLNVLIADEDGQLAEMGATVGEEEYRTGLGEDFVSHTDQVDLALDVQAALSTLPAELQEIAERLKRQSVCEMARELGVSKSTLNRRVVEIREHFRRAGLARTS
jgi:RNA polymerase sigma factor (sigma-70 family)